MPIDELTNPDAIYDRESALTQPCPIPEKPGVYAWYFRDIPSIVPLEGCIEKRVNKNSAFLLYIGTSKNLRKRIKTNHYSGKARNSTLRKSLGVLLNFPLERKVGKKERKVGKKERKVGKKTTFTLTDEQRLDEWMEENAFVCWKTHTNPEELGELEKKLLGELSLPLNIKGNNHPFVPKLKQLRKEAVERGEILRKEAVEKGEIE